MNLSQAVTVLAYTLRMEQGSLLPITSSKDIVPLKERELLINKGLKAYTLAGLLKGWDLKRSEHRLRKALTRWDLTNVDVAD